MTSPLLSSSRSASASCDLHLFHAHEKYPAAHSGVATPIHAKDAHSLTPSIIGCSHALYGESNQLNRAASAAASVALEGLCIELGEGEEECDELNGETAEDGANYRYVGVANARAFHALPTTATASTSSSPLLEDGARRLMLPQQFQTPLALGGRRSYHRRTPSAQVVQPSSLPLRAVPSPVLGPRMDSSRSADLYNQRLSTALFGQSERAGVLSFATMPTPVTARSRASSQRPFVNTTSQTAGCDNPPSSTPADEAATTAASLFNDEVNCSATVPPLSPGDTAHVDPTAPLHTAGLPAPVTYFRVAPSLLMVPPKAVQSHPFLPGSGDGGRQGSQGSQDRSIYSCRCGDGIGHSRDGETTTPAADRSGASTPLLNASTPLLSAAAAPTLRLQSHRGLGVFTGGRGNGGWGDSSWSASTSPLCPPQSHPTIDGLETPLFSKSFRLNGDDPICYGTEMGSAATHQMTSPQFHAGRCATPQLATPASAITPTPQQHTTPVLRLTSHISPSIHTATGAARHLSTPHHLSTPVHHHYNSLEDPGTASGRRRDYGANSRSPGVPFVGTGVGGTAASTPLVPPLFSGLPAPLRSSSTVRRPSDPFELLRALRFADVSTDPQLSPLHCGCLGVLMVLGSRVMLLGRQYGICLNRVPENLSTAPSTAAITAITSNDFFLLQEDGGACCKGTRASSPSSPGAGLTPMELGRGDEGITTEDSGGGGSFGGGYCAYLVMGDAKGDVHVDIYETCTTTAAGSIRLEEETLAVHVRLVSRGAVRCDQRVRINEAAGAASPHRNDANSSRHAISALRLCGHVLYIGDVSGCVTRLNLQTDLRFCPVSDNASDASSASPTIASPSMPSHRGTEEQPEIPRLHTRHHPPPQHPGQPVHRFRPPLTPAATTTPTTIIPTSTSAAARLSGNGDGAHVISSASLPLYHHLSFHVGDAVYRFEPTEDQNYLAIGTARRLLVYTAHQLPHAVDAAYSALTPPEEWRPHHSSALPHGWGPTPLIIADHAALPIRCFQWIRYDYDETADRQRGGGSSSSGPGEYPPFITGVGDMECRRRSGSVPDPMEVGRHRSATTTTASSATAATTATATSAAGAAAAHCRPSFGLPPSLLFSISEVRDAPPSVSFADPLVHRVMLYRIATRTIEASSTLEMPAQFLAVLPRTMEVVIGTGRSQTAEEATNCSPPRMEPASSTPPAAGGRRSGNVLEEALRNVRGLHLPLPELPFPPAPVSSTQYDPHPAHNPAQAAAEPSSDSDSSHSQRWARDTESSVRQPVGAEAVSRTTFTAAHAPTAGSLFLLELEAVQRGAMTSPLCGYGSSHERPLVRLRCIGERSLSSRESVVHGTIHPFKDQVLVIVQGDSSGGEIESPRLKKWCVVTASGAGQPTIASALGDGSGNMLCGDVQLR